MAKKKDLLFGTELIKGHNVDGVPLVAWDMVPICDQDKCPISSRCRLKGKDRCLVHAAYLDHVYDVLALRKEDQLTLEESHKIGLFMIPLYGHLARFKIYEAGLKTPLIGGQKGSSVANPVYREIRETIKLLSALHRDLKNGGSGGVVAPEEYDRSLVHGDPDYYRELYEEGNGKRTLNK